MVFTDLALGSRTWRIALAIVWRETHSLARTHRGLITGDVVADGELAGGACIINRTGIENQTVKSPSRYLSDIGIDKWEYCWNERI